MTVFRKFHSIHLFFSQNLQRQLKFLSDNQTNELLTTIIVDEAELANNQSISVFKGVPNPASRLSNPLIPVSNPVLSTQSYETLSRILPWTTQNPDKYILDPTMNTKSFQICSESYHEQPILSNMILILPWTQIHVKHVLVFGPNTQSDRPDTIRILQPIKHVPNPTRTADRNGRVSDPTSYTQSYQTRF